MFHEFSPTVSVQTNKCLLLDDMIHSEKIHRKTASCSECSPFHMEAQGPKIFACKVFK